MGTAVAGISMGDSPGSVRLEPTWRRKKDISTTKPRTTMLDTIPLKAAPTSDLQRQLRNWEVDGRIERILLRGFPDLPALLAANRESLETAGLSGISGLFDKLRK